MEGLNFVVFIYFIVLSHNFDFYLIIREFLCHNLKFRAHNFNFSCRNFIFIAHNYDLL